jgi:hypothetical protein
MHRVQPGEPRRAPESRPERARGTMLAQIRGCPGRCRSLRRTSPALAAPSASEQRPRRRHPRPGLERVVQDDRPSCARRCEAARRVDDRRGRPDRRRVHELRVGDNDEVHVRADEDSGALLGDVRAARGSRSACASPRAAAELHGRLEALDMVDPPRVGTPTAVPGYAVRHFGLAGNPSDALLRHEKPKVG